jgi:hypothetical protein
MRATDSILPVWTFKTTQVSDVRHEAEVGIRVVEDEVTDEPIGRQGVDVGEGVRERQAVSA